MNEWMGEWTDKLVADGSRAASLGQQKTQWHLGLLIKEGWQQIIDRRFQSQTLPGRLLVG